MATLSSLMSQVLRRKLKPRQQTVRRRPSPLSQLMDQLELEMRWVPATIFALPGVNTINAAIASASPGDTIQLSAGNYYGWVVIPASLPGLKIEGVPGAILRAPNNDVTEQNGNGSGRIISVLADDVRIANLTIDGAGNAPSSVYIGSTPIWASKGIANGLAPGNFASISNLTIFNTEILNLGGDAISLNGSVNGGNISNNDLHSFGAEGCLSPWAGIFLGDNSMANITNNTITLSGYNYGIQVDNIASSSPATFANNTISVSQSSIGITINLLYDSAGNITVANNTITAQANVTSSTPFRTRGINVFSVYTGTINLNNNTIAGPGQFDRGINIWNVVNNVNINGGSIGNAAVGVKVDGVDSYYGRSIINTNVSIANATISGQVGLAVTNNNQTLPPEAIAEGYIGIPAANVTVNVTGGSITTTSTGGNAIEIRSNSNATHQARVNALGSLSITGSVARLGGVGNLSIFNDNRSPRNFDFGGGPVAAGFISVPASTLYTASLGYGFGMNLATWNSAAAPITNALTQDGVQGGAFANAAANTVFSPANANGTFLVDLGAGNYSVTAYVGSRIAAGGYNRSTIVEALVGNTVVASYSANTSFASPFASGTMSTFTLSSPTTVTFRFRAPLGWNWAVNGLTITAVP